MKIYLYSCSGLIFHFLQSTISNYTQEAELLQYLHNTIKKNNCKKIKTYFFESAFFFFISLFSPVVYLNITLSIHHLMIRKLAEAFLITSCSTEFLREQNELVSGAGCTFKSSISVGGVLWARPAWRLTRQPLLRRVKGSRTDCVIDCHADVTWNGLQRCSCTAPQNGGYGV